MPFKVVYASKTSMNTLTYHTETWLLSTEILLNVVTRKTYIEDLHSTVVDKT
ncbi:hypothetical protein BGW80DRAFT_1351673 [Lactifluus volemus]|nr:hypothetical protein BGW80DRAFT_1351673 [Lactifluus volemus]